MTNLFVGALIGFLSSIIAAYLLVLIQQEIRSRVLASALSEEINALWERYNQSIGDDLEALQGSDENQLLGEFFASRDYFTVYDGIAHELPIINNSKIIKTTIQFYIQTKGHLDSWSQYNSVFLRWQSNIKDAHTTESNKLSHMYFQGTDRNLKEVLNMYKNDVLINEFKHIKNLHKILSTELNDYVASNFIIGLKKRVFS
jgi:hypothetical protein